MAARTQLKMQLQVQRDKVESLKHAQAADIRRTQQQLRQLDQACTRLLDAYQAGAIQLQELRARRERIDEQIVLLEGRLEQLRRQSARALEQTTVVDAASTWCERIRTSLADCTYEDRREIVRALIERIDVGDGKLTIHYVVPLEPPEAPATLSSDGTPTPPTSSSPGSAPDPTTAAALLGRPCCNGRGDSQLPIREDAQRLLPRGTSDRARTE